METAGAYLRHKAEENGENNENLVFVNRSQSCDMSDDLSSGVHICEPLNRELPY
jgi:hypothetical protein